MDVRQVLKGMGGLGGSVWWVEARGLDDEYHGPVWVRSVDGLRVDERVDVERGNVIFWNGNFDVEGRPDGWVFWARDVLELRWDEDEGRRLVVRSRNGGATFSWMGDLEVGGGFGEVVDG